MPPKQSSVWKICPRCKEGYWAGVTRTREECDECYKIAYDRTKDTKKIIEELNAK